MNMNMNMNMEIKTLVERLLAMTTAEKILYLTILQRTVCAGVDEAAIPAKAIELHESTTRMARVSLQERGLIEFAVGRINQAPLYKITGSRTEPTFVRDSSEGSEITTSAGQASLPPKPRHDHVDDDLYVNKDHHHLHPGAWRGSGGAVSSGIDSATSGIASEEIVQRLMVELSFNERAARSLIKQFPVKQIKTSMDNLALRPEVRNPAGYLVRELQAGGYPPPIMASAANKVVMVGDRVGRSEIPINEQFRTSKNHRAMPISAQICRIQTQYETYCNHAQCQPIHPPQNEEPAEGVGRRAQCSGLPR